MDKILNYIDGEFIESLDKSWINNVDPSIGKVYSLIPDSEDKDRASSAVCRTGF